MATISRRTFATSLAVAPFAGWSLRARPVGAQGAPLKVVATFSVLGDVVANVAGGAVDLAVLVGPDGDAHTFEPSPSDIAKVAEAALIFENGAGFEPWLDDVYAASESQATRVVVTKGLTLLAFEEGGHDHGEEHGDEEHTDQHAEREEHAEDEHAHGDEGDPHVWHDVRNVIAEVAVIRDALSTADSANVETYEANAARYLAQLEELDAFARAEADTLPPERRKIVTSHDALGYLAAAYGFEIVATALGSLSTETADPSAGEIAELVEQIRATGVPAIFTENIESGELMQQIADDAGVALAPPLYTDALGPAGSPAATYVEMVRYNMTTIVTALGGAAR